MHTPNSVDPMMKFVLSVFLLISLSTTNLLATELAVVDSIGIETIEGKKFIVHKVEPKETLYALSRRYQVTVDDILTHNEKEKDGYAIDQIGRILYIPLYKEMEATPSQGVRKEHVVQSGETLYGLSRKYEVSVTDLKKWNQLKSNNLDLGQKLWVSKPSNETNVTKPTNTTAGTSSQTNNAAEKVKSVYHTVQAGETIYGISRKYSVDQAKIKEWNKLASNEISIGQRLIVQKGAGQSVVAVVTEEESQEQELPETYAAKKGETYADVAEKFNLILSDVEEWNVFKEPFAGGEVIRLTPKEKASNNAAVTEVKQPVKQTDKKVHIVQSGETIYSLSDDYGVDMEDVRKWNQLDNYQLSVGQKLYIKNPDAFVVDQNTQDTVEKEKEDNLIVETVVEASSKPQNDTKAYFTVEEEDIPKIEKVVEKGVAEVIPGSETTEKNLALHKTAKIGTIMQVKNELNDQIIFVRVLGRLPDTGVDEKVIIRISKKAFQKLGGVDYKFPVEISYLPLDD